VAYVLNAGGDIEDRCNRGMVELAQVDPSSDDAIRIRALLNAHVDATGSTVARDLLDRGTDALSDFVRVLPLPFKEAVREGKATMPEFA
jgi:glutamate synthase (NADPH/NADH) large chain